MYATGLFPGKIEILGIIYVHILEMTNRFCYLYIFQHVLHVFAILEIHKYVGDYGWLRL